MPRSSKAPIVLVQAPKRAPRKKKASAPGIGRLRGHGAYTYEQPGPWGRIGSAAGGMIGSAIGTPYGLGKPGGQIGKKLGSYLHYIGKIFGSGDYVTSSAGVRTNSLMQSNQIPSFVMGKNDVRICHREYLGDILSSSTAGAFNIQSFPLNPGLEETFPWLSEVCGATFQQYRINGMVFEFRSMSADALNSTNTALGSVVMATDYDSRDDVFSSKQQMENTMFGVSCKPSSCMLHAIECERSQTSVSELYIRPYAVPSNSDIRLYDLGRFSIATQGCQGTNVNLGELWVSYDVSLFKQIDQPPGYLISAAHFPLDVARLATAPIAKSPTLTNSYDNIGLTIDSAGLNLTFPRSTQAGTVFSVFLQHTSTGPGPAAVTPVGITSTGGMIAGPRLLNNGSFGISWPNPSPGAANSRQTGLQYFYTYDGTGTISAPPTLTFTASATPFTAYLGGDLIITQMFPKML
jgi:hypothetical protein